MSRIQAGSPGPEPTQEEPRSSEKSSSRKSSQEASCPLTSSRETKGLHVVTGLSLPCQGLTPRVQFTSPKLPSGSLNKHLWHEGLREEEKNEWTKAERKRFHFDREATAPTHPEHSGVRSWGRQAAECNYLVTFRKSPKLLKRISPSFCRRRNRLGALTEPPRPPILTTLFSALPLSSWVPTPFFPSRKINLTGKSG